MKKIIGGKRYDTDTAKEVGFDSFGYPRDFNHWKETLYRKNTGEFFLHGEGGPQTKYATADGLSGWSSGERILPLTIAEAKEWAEKHMTADEYEAVFEIADEDAGKKTVSFSLPQWAIDKIATYAAEWKISKSEVIEKFIKERE